MAKNESGFHSSIWGQATAALIAVALGPGVLWLLGRLAEASIPDWLYVAGLVAVASLVSMVYPPWRRTIWGNVGRWRPFTTAGTIERVREDTRAAVEAEHEAKRARPIPRAQWLISRTNGDNFLWSIMNVAPATIARYVQVTAEPGSFRPGSGMDWENLDGNPDVNDRERVRSGTFRGVATEHGLILGVDFLIEWTDANDERQATTVRIGGM